MKKVLFTENGFSESDIQLLSEKGIEIVPAEGDLKEKELIQALQGCSGYVIGGTDKATQKVIESSNLEIIVFYGTGYENFVDVKASSNKGITVAYTPKANAYTVAEHTAALILDAVKGITNLNNSVKQGKWSRRQTWNLSGKTLGILGMGTIGSHVATIMSKGFGMKVIYVSRTEKSEIEQNLGAKKVAINELMSQSDVVSIHIPSNKENISLISKNEIGLMKPTSILINSARAELVDPIALSEALKQNKITSAAFDVYYEEPAPSLDQDKYKLLSLPDNKFIITPHTAYSSKEAIENMNQMVKENLMAFFSGKKPPYCVQ